MKTRDIVQTIIAIMVLFSMVFGALNYLAKAEDVRQLRTETRQSIEQMKEEHKLLSLSLRLKIVTDQILETKRIIYMLQDRYGKLPVNEWANVLDKESYRFNLQTLEELQLQRKKLLDEQKK